jgi:hypothetical protein
LILCWKTKCHKATSIEFALNMVDRLANLHPLVEAGKAKSHRSDSASDGRGGDDGGAATNDGEATTADGETADDSNGAVDGYDDEAAGATVTRLDIIRAFRFAMHSVRFKEKRVEIVGGYCILAGGYVFADPELYEDEGSAYTVKHPQLKQEVKLEPVGLPELIVPWTTSRGVSKSIGVVAATTSFITLVVSRFWRRLGMRAHQRHFLLLKYVIFLQSKVRRQQQRRISAKIFRCEKNFDEVNRLIKSQCSVWQTKREGREREERRQGRRGVIR